MVCKKRRKNGGQKLLGWDEGIVCSEDKSNSTLPFNYIINLAMNIKTLSLSRSYLGGGGQTI